MSVENYFNETLKEWSVSKVREKKIHSRTWTTCMIENINAMKNDVRIWRKSFMENVYVTTSH